MGLVEWEWVDLTKRFLRMKIIHMISLLQSDYYTIKAMLNDSDREAFKALVADLNQ